MCLDPVGLIGMGLSMAGSVMQANQQQAMVNAQNAANRQAYEIAKRAREQEVARQAQFETQANDNWTNTLADMSRDKADQTRTDAEEKFLTSYDTLPNQFSGDGYMLSGQDMASDAVKQAISGSVSTAAADARKRVQALAALSGYGTTDQSRANNLQEGANFLTTLNGLRRGSLAVSQQEQSISPGTVSGGSSPLPAILSGVGGAVAKGGGYNYTVNG